MSTEALVGMEIKHGLVRYIHVSHDGYFTGAGESILKLYQARGATEAIMNTGDRRSVEGNPNRECFKANYVESEEDNWDAKIANNQQDFLTKLEHYGADFAYLQTMDGEWTCYSREAGWWRPLKQRLAELKDRGNAEFQYYALGYISDNEYYSCRITLKGPAKQTTVEKEGLEILNIEVYVEKYQWFRKATQHEIDEIKCFMIQRERVTERLQGKARISRDSKTVEVRKAEQEAADLARIKHAERLVNS